MKTNEKNLSTLRLLYAAVCLALCLLLPFVTGQIPEIGKMLLPMHFPVLLAGFLCGPWWALAVGAVAPLLRFALTGMPPIYPTGTAMAFELAAYGVVAGLLWKALPKKTVNIYTALVAAMLLGRVVWGAVMVVLTGLGGSAFTWSAFLAGGFLNAIPGIIAQLLLIPVVVMALRKAGVIA